MPMHGKFSRWMASRPLQRRPWGALFVTALFVAGLGYVLLTHPVATLAVVAAFAVMCALADRKRARQASLLLEQRVGEDIGSFAHAFDRRHCPPPDPWAIRAVWNALLPLTETRGRPIPLRPADRFDDLYIDPDDVEDLLESLVEQCERVPGNWAANPYSAKVDTVGSLVHFISAQPLREPNYSSAVP